MNRLQSTDPLFSALPFYRTSLLSKPKRLEDSNGNLAKSRISANVTSVLGGFAFFIQFFVRQVIAFLCPKLLTVSPVINLTCAKPLVTQATTKVV